MWSVSPLRRHFCVVLLTLTCITSYLSIQEKYNYKNRGFLTNSSDVPVGTEFIHAADLNDNSFVVSSVWPERKSGRKNDIYILGLFELSTQFGARVEGLAETTAAQLAVNHVNHLQVLPYYNLKLLINDTKVGEQFKPTKIKLCRFCLINSSFTGFINNFRNYPTNFQK